MTEIRLFRLFTRSSTLVGARVIEIGQYFNRGSMTVRLGMRKIENPSQRDKDLAQRVEGTRPDPDCFFYGQDEDLAVPIFPVLTALAIVSTARVTAWSGTTLSILILGSRSTPLPSRMAGYSPESINHLPRRLSPGSGRTRGRPSLPGSRKKESASG